jgi:hypothetical protein
MSPPFLFRNANPLTQRQFVNITTTQFLGIPQKLAKEVLKALKNKGKINKRV